jgi:hypothetical protein
MSDIDNLGLGARLKKYFSKNGLRDNTVTIVGYLTPTTEQHLTTRDVPKFWLSQCVISFKGGNSQGRAVVRRRAGSGL